MCGNTTPHVISALHYNNIIEYLAAMKMNKLKWHKQCGEIHRYNVAKQKLNTSTGFHLCKGQKQAKWYMRLEFKGQVLLMEGD